jgi:hypothetical protein
MATEQELAEQQAAAEQQETKTGADENQQQQQQQQPPSEDIPEEVLLQQLEKRLGFKPESLDSLKPKTPEPTETEKAAQLAARDKQRLDKFVASGGKVEDYVNIKKLTEVDVKEFSIQSKRAELKAAGYDEAEIDEQMKLRYHLYTDEELAAFGDDAEKMKKLSAYYKEKLENGSKYQIEVAKKFFADLDKQIDDEAYVSKVDADIISNVEKTVATMERTITFELGEANDQPINPVQFTVEDKHLSEIKKVLSDKATRESLLYNPDGTENVQNLVDLLKWKYIATDLAKKANLQGRTEEVEKFEKVFPNNHFAVAPANVVKGAKTGNVGKVVEGSEKVMYNTTAKTKP